MYCNIQVLFERQLEGEHKGDGDDEVRKIRSRLLEKSDLEGGWKKKLK